MLIECKHWSANLDPHDSQLFRYFHTTNAKFGILTNGIMYRFYTDLVESNKMDEKPFPADEITVVTTAEELEAFYIVRAILAAKINVSRVVMR